MTTKSVTTEANVNATSASAMKATLATFVSMTKSSAQDTKVSELLKENTPFSYFGFIVRRNQETWL